MLGIKEQNSYNCIQYPPKADSRKATLDPALLYLQNSTTQFNRYPVFATKTITLKS